MFLHNHKAATNATGWDAVAQSGLELRDAAGIEVGIGIFGPVDALAIAAAGKNGTAVRTFMAGGLRARASSVCPKVGDPAFGAFSIAILTGQT